VFGPAALRLRQVGLPGYVGGFSATLRDAGATVGRGSAGTASLIQESFDRAEAGSHQIDQVSAAILGITERVTKARRLVEQVSTATEEQAQGTLQVSQAVANMEQVTQTTAATAEESAAATRS
jgi:methyl-accepting chemotaxis protein